MAAAPWQPLPGTSMAKMGCRAAGAIDYSDRHGRRYQNHPLAGLRVSTCGSALKIDDRQNKGLHHTAHPLPNLGGLAMIHLVGTSHYGAVRRW